MGNYISESRLSPGMFAAVAAHRSLNRGTKHV